MICKTCGETNPTAFKQRSSGYIPKTCYGCEKKAAKEARKSRYADPLQKEKIRSQNSSYQDRKKLGQTKPHIPAVYTPKPIESHTGSPKCQKCERPAFSHGFCHSCVQRISPAQKYPWLQRLCDENTFRMLDSSKPPKHVDVGCEKCGRISNVLLLSVVKTYEGEYLCRPCSVVGNTGISFDSILPVIDVQSTIQEFGSLPVNIRTDMVVAKCEDCHVQQRVKASSVLNQARRHKINGVAAVYKCFGCGIKRPDLIVKAGEARAALLKSGFKSGLEIAMENRLNLLGIEFENQYPVDMYSFDFFLPKYNCLLEVNGEYWHSLPENRPKDAAKATYVERYRPDLRLLKIEERNFFNPKMVDHILLSFLGVEAPVLTRQFSFSDVQIALKKNESDYLQFLDSYHYAKCGRKGKHVFEARLGDTIIAVCKFNSVTRQETALKQDVKYTEILELDRFCIHPEYHKKNFATWFISRCVNRIMNDIPTLKKLVSFADPLFGHPGVIYQASNWAKDGETSASYHYIDSCGIPINKKRVYDTASKLRMKELEYVAKHGLIRVEEPPKIRYVYTRRLAHGPRNGKPGSSS